jgi:hypothetical protein
MTAIAMVVGSIVFGLVSARFGAEDRPGFSERNSVA